jgi:hypothetical protein
MDQVPPACHLLLRAKGLVADIWLTVGSRGVGSLTTSFGARVRQVARIQQIRMSEDT